MSERTELVARLPWVTRLARPAQCTAIKAHTPLKALYRMGGKPPVGLDRYRCKQPAYWRFRSLKKSMARDGDYCWSHLRHHGLYGDMDERERTNRAMARLQEKADS
jgi:hypothetical protein